MTRALKVATFALALVAFGSTYAVYSLGVREWPPVATLEDGSCAPLQVATVETCLQARGLELFGDRQAGARWAGCRAYLERFRALGAFDLRYYGVPGSFGLGVVALFAFALGVRFYFDTFERYATAVRAAVAVPADTVAGVHAKLALAVIASRRGGVRIYMYEDREWLEAALADLRRLAWGDAGAGETEAGEQARPGCILT